MQPPSTQKTNVQITRAAARLNQKDKQIANLKKLLKKKNKKNKKTPITGSTVPQAFGHEFSRKSALIKGSQNGNVIVSHTEYLASITGSGDYQIQSMAVNPGDPLTFPWLSMMASAYEKFSVIDMEFVYKATCSTQENGVFFMYPEYTVTDGPAANLMAALNFQNAVSGNAWGTHKLKIYPKQFNQVNNYIIRSQYKTYSAKDMLLTDPLIFRFGTEDTEDTPGIGKLYIKYTIELKVPSVDNSFVPLNFGYAFNTVPINLYNGNYVPDFSSALATRYNGNYQIAGLNGQLSFPGPFCGIVVMKFVASNFDASRVPTITVTGDGNTGVLVHAVLNDETLGTDTWMAMYKLVFQSAGAMVFNSSWTTGSVTGDCYFDAASALPAYMETASQSSFTTSIPKKKKSGLIDTKKKSSISSDKLIRILFSQLSLNDEDGNDLSSVEDR